MELFGSLYNAMPLYSGSVDVTSEILLVRGCRYNIPLCDGSVDVTSEILLVRGCRYLHVNKQIQSINQSISTRMCFKVSYCMFLCWPPISKSPITHVKLYLPNLFQLWKNRF